MRFGVGIEGHGMESMVRFYGTRRTVAKAKKAGPSARTEVLSRDDNRWKDSV